jgi:hypothetical protein
MTQLPTLQTPSWPQNSGQFGKTELPGFAVRRTEPPGQPGLRAEMIRLAM